MSVIIIPRKHLRQPHGRVEVDWANPFALRLALLVLHSRGEIRDLVSGSVATLGAKTFETRAAVLGGRFYSGAQWAERRIVTSTGDFSGDFTYLSFSAPAAVATRGVLAASCFTDKQSYLFANTDTAYAASPGRLTFGGYDGATRFVSAPSVIDGRPHVFIGTRLAGTGVISVDGSDVATGSLGMGAMGNPFTRLSVESLYGYTGYGDSTTPHFLTAAWDRGLPGVERTEIATAPWQLFRADPIRIYSFPSGAITITSITASNITQTGARITLGLTR